jgi:predicted transcriptional regulator
LQHDQELLVCLACGKKQRMLKRHLAREHDLTPNAYREMFSLKQDYPMVAPSYAEARRELAMKIGLGRPRTPTKKEAPAPTKEEVPTKTRRTRAKAA